MIPCSVKGNLFLLAILSSGFVQVLIPRMGIIFIFCLFVCLFLSFFLYFSEFFGTLPVKETIETIHRLAIIQGQKIVETTVDLKIKEKD